MSESAKSVKLLDIFNELEDDYKDIVIQMSEALIRKSQNRKKEIIHRDVIKGWPL